jgi:hypothetical protein
MTGSQPFKACAEDTGELASLGKCLGKGAVTGGPIAAATVSSAPPQATVTASKRQSNGGSSSPALSSPSTDPDPGLSSPSSDPPSDSGLTAPSKAASKRQAPVYAVQLIFFLSALTCFSSVARLKKSRVNSASSISTLALQTHQCMLFN